MGTLGTEGVKNEAGAHLSNTGNKLQGCHKVGWEEEGGLGQNLVDQHRQFYELGVIVVKPEWSKTPTFKQRSKAVIFKTYSADYLC